MNEEYFPNRAEIFHGSIVSRYCYYIVIRGFRYGIYLAKSFKDYERR
jgi:hypothetical protein